jgi:hypothetical protein
VELIDETSDQDAHDLELTRVYRHGDRRVRVHVRRNTYVHQSRAEAAVLNGRLEWTVLVHEPASQWHAAGRHMTGLREAADRVAYRAGVILGEDAGVPGPAQPAPGAEGARSVPLPAARPSAGASIRSALQKVDTTESRRTDLNVALHAAGMQLRAADGDFSPEHLPYGQDDPRWIAGAHASLRQALDACGNLTQAVAGALAETAELLAPDAAYEAAVEAATAAYRAARGAGKDAGPEL